MARTYTHRLEKGALTVGFLALAVAVVVAHRNPARAYEVSIYLGAPALFWVGVGVALAVTIGVALSSPDWYRSLALVLGGVATLSIAALPVLRGYHFFGAGDSLTHLGWAKDIAAGEMAAYDLLYPGTHTIAVALHEATGVSLRRSLLLMVVAFTLAYLLFVPLAVRTMTGDDRATTFAALAGFLMLPINNISVFEMAHPTSQAILFLPFVLYLVVKYVTRSDGWDIPVLGSAAGTLLALASVAFVLVHPQQAANVVLLFGGCVVVQFVYRLFRSEHTIARHRPMYAQTVFLVSVFLLWAPQHERSGGATRALLTRLLTGGEVAGDIGQRAVGLSQLGGSLESLFLKLFLVSIFFCALAAAFMFGGLLGRIRGSDTNAFSKYAAVGMIPITGLFAVFLATSYSQMHFRVLGFAMVPVTLFGAIAFARGSDALAARVPNGKPVAVGVVVAFVLLFALAVPTLFGSPYVYKPSGHVTEGTMTGYDTAFGQRGDADFVGLRSPAERYSDGVLGYEESRSSSFRGEGIYGNLYATGENFTASTLVAAYEEPRYLPITAGTRKQELDVYHGLRFPERGFRTLESNPGVARVQSGGGFELYYVNGTRSGDSGGTADGGR